jgi:hypothetical protein
VANARLASPDGDLRGREIAVAVAPVQGGYRLRGRLRVAVPPAPLGVLAAGTESLVRLFPDHVAGIGRWPAGREERFFFAAKLFGRVFRAWGHVTRESSPDRAVVRWRTDKGALGSATATRRGRGSDIFFEGFFPSSVDIAKYLPGLGVEIVLRIMAFAIRARIEQLWRDGELPAEMVARERPWAGISPPSPRLQGSPPPPTVRVLPRNN